MHICSRDTCPSKNVSGPKILCAKCQKTCFLLCFGFEKCGNNGIKLKLTSNCHIGVDPNSICFTCPNCDASFLTDAVNEKLDSTNAQNVSKTLQQAPKAKPTTTKTLTSTDSPITFTQMKNDFAKMNKILSSIAMKIDISASDLCEMKIVTAETNSMVKSINVNSNELNTNFSTQINDIVAQAQNTLSSQAQSFSSIVQQQQNEERKQIKIKRKLEENSMAKPVSNKPKNLPAAKIGKRTGVVGLAVAAPKTAAKAKPQFDKSLHVSRLATSVTVDELNEYISTNSSLIVNEDFKCMRLVKKDQSAEALSFISFKVDVIAAKCESLFEEEFWPDGVSIRPFIPKTTLGDFINTPTRNQPNKIMKPNDEKNINSNEITENQSKINEQHSDSSNNINDNDKNNDQTAMVIEIV